LFEIFSSFPLKVSENYADKANFERFHQPSSATSTDLANPRNTNYSPRTPTIAVRYHGVRPTIRVSIEI